MFRFPVPSADINALEQMLTAQNPFVTSFSHNLRDVYSIRTYHQQRAIHETTAFLLPDRQIVSYLKTLFTGGSIPESERRLVGAIMAFAILAEIKIEPRMAMYEYADLNGVDAAWSDLSIFRHADNTDVKLFVDLALGRISSIPKKALYISPTPFPSKPANFLTPRIWSFDFCYPFILKIALLEQSRESQLQKMLDFEDWMFSEYFFGSAGGLFANLFLSPSRVKRMIKNLNSPNRDLRLRGIRNATWDITFIEDWAEHARKESKTNQLWLGASNDKAVLKTAGRLLTTEDISDEGMKTKLLNIFREDWDATMAETIFQKYCELESRVGEAWRPANKALPKDCWQQLCCDLEAKI